MPIAEWTALQERPNDGPIGFDFVESERVHVDMKPGFSTTIVIEVPPAMVFGFLADPLTASVIDPAVMRYDPEGGTMGLGIRNHIHLRIMGVPIQMTSVTTAWEPGQRMEFRSIRPGRPVSERPPIGSSHRITARSTPGRCTSSPRASADGPSLRSPPAPSSATPESNNAE
ncbi:MAG TPA: SRPBCC family protein [Acidimicrobiales bacterium]|nr:SRPBCC family protein [Acidimicrobiales bacterium]